ncbi:hypothetical protein K501DRAFT_227135 [Backusella circina FSU 941]|nr:hypothetical protein K501DRAFT_227135 [Backusella circina FSU 941]
MTNNNSTTTSTWLNSHNIVDSLNQVLDPVSVLSDMDLQEELAVFANAQFKYDIAPGTAIDDCTKILDTEQASGYAMNTNDAKYRRESKQSHNMHSLLNVKLASLAENNYHTSMSHDAITRFYDESPDCSPPNGYYSPNPSPPNGMNSPNPTPPNGYHLTSAPTVFHAVVNPPITFYGDDAVMGYEDDEFMKTMRILTSATPYESEPIHHKPTQSKIEKAKIAGKKRETITTSTSMEKKADIEVSDEFTELNDDNMDENPTQNENENGKKTNTVLTKEDKRRRNTAASARFRVKKKQREQALQHTANEMTEKANMLENRVKELEQQVKWLKALVVEKKDSRFEEIFRHHENAQYNSAAGLNTDLYFSLTSQHI